MSSLSDQSINRFGIDGVTTSQGHWQEQTDKFKTCICHLTMFSIVFTSLIRALSIAALGLKSAYYIKSQCNRLDMLFTLVAKVPTDIFYSLSVFFLKKCVLYSAFLIFSRNFIHFVTKCDQRKVLMRCIHATLFNDIDVIIYIM